MIQWGDGKTIEDPVGPRGQTDLEFFPRGPRGQTDLRCSGSAVLGVRPI